MFGKMTGKFKKGDNVVLKRALDKEGGQYWIDNGFDNATVNSILKNHYEIIGSLGFPLYVKENEIILKPNK